MKIVIAPDSFKGSLSSVEVAEAVRKGILSVMPHAEIVSVPLGDGGEGTAEAISSIFGGEKINCQCIDPLGRTIQSEYFITNDGVAFIDTSSSCGLTLLRNITDDKFTDNRNITLATTRGLGIQIKHAISNCAKRIYVGLGGSATCDGGVGMLSELGWKFRDCNGKEIIYPKDFRFISSIEAPANANSMLQDIRISLLADVSNSLFGLTGSAMVFAPQKGANEEEVILLDNGLRRLSLVAGRYFGKDYSQYAGAGAAGGLGWAFMTFLNAEMNPGIETVLDMLDFDSYMQGADLVITGEGRMDNQTLSGKLPFGVSRRAARYGVAAFALCGSVENKDELLMAGFKDILPISSSSLSLEIAMQKEVAFNNIVSTATKIVRDLL